ncbi:hypothetical protein V6N11_001914 [Hibiscus sabdariffa]|uniref:Uncharacterized protein n=1 Tax=Hibiscus sabdariffa TaxID=183260 RepID=A0ABR2QU87_9ROSI
MVEYTDPIISVFIDRDNKDAFLRRIQHEAQSVGGYDVYQSLMLSEILASLYCGTGVKCATALLQGETGLKPDINAVDPRSGCTPPHHFSDEPELLDLFIRHGARTDIRCEGLLPLDCAIRNISDIYGIDRGLPTRHSIYLTIVLMCGLHELERFLECVGLLFRASQEVEKEIYCYVKDGKLLEIAALLTVAREEVTSPSLFKGLCDPGLNGSMSLRQLVLSEIVSLMASQVKSVSTIEEVHDELNHKLETMMSMLRTIEVFERVGDKIELYRRYLTKCFEEFWAAQMACMLISEGLAEYKDFQLRSDDGSNSTKTVSGFEEDYFSKIFEWNLYQGMPLESGTTKMYKQYHVDPMWIPRLSNKRPTLEAILIPNDEDDAKGSLALRVSLAKLCHHPYLNDWTSKNSVFKLVCILCLPQLKESLESIRLVACKTDEIKAIGCNFARQGKLIELATLLMVAPEELIESTSTGSKDMRSNSIRRCIMSDLQALLDSEVRLTGRSKNHKLVEKCKDEKEMKLSTLLLLEVFERVGKSINHHLQSDTYNDGTRSRLEIAGKIQNMLENAGFAMKPKDTDLNDIKCLPSTLRPYQFSVAENLFGSRSFHTVVPGSSKCRGPCTSKALKHGIRIPNVVAGKSTGWFLSLGVAITKLIKRV